eukprot:250566-Chlamydomonas_euryale.AAC.2
MDSCVSFCQRSADEELMNASRASLNSTNRPGVNALVVFLYTLLRFFIHPHIHTRRGAVRFGGCVAGGLLAGAGSRQCQVWT